MENSEIFTGRQTIAFVIKPSWTSRAKKIIWKFFIIFMPPAVGFFSCKLLWPSIIEAPKEVIKYQRVERIKEKEPSKEMIEREVDREVRNRMDFLGKGLYGVLEIKDNAAQTVLYKKAAIGKIGEFEQLENNKPYIVRSYLSVKDTGYGLVEYGTGSFVVIVWRSGKVKAPLANPGKIRIPQGVRVETGDFQ